VSDKDGVKVQSFERQACIRRPTYIFIHTYIYIYIYIYILYIEW
jgi:hypothetical protein